MLERSRASERAREEAASRGTVAATGSTALLLGETGTGKERFAVHIHECSPRPVTLLHVLEHVDAASIEALVAHAWPGNVRERRNMVERAMIMATGLTLRIALPAAETPKVIPRSDVASLVDLLLAVGTRYAANLQSNIKGKR